MKTAKLESIWSEYEHAIHAFLRSKVSNEDDVDDLKQEILLKTYQNLGDIRDVSSVNHGYSKSPITPSSISTVNVYEISVIMTSSLMIFGLKNKKRALNKNCPSALRRFCRRYQKSNRNSCLLLNLKA